ncbi:MAG TPA: GNAT family N-acetyltransferase [Ktedonobacteraceae bacterium]|nr:GNAT family N-acetyltransferase [Ktedonobacteraceae bacterium]
MSISQRKNLSALDITIRLLRESELNTADRIFRHAFGTFLGLPDPQTFAGDSDVVQTRWKADPTRVFAAQVEGELVGTNVASNWGSVGFFGPLTIRPDLWDRGIAQRLMEPVMEKFSEWGTRHAGLFTFPHSPKHIHLYEKFGFFARFLTPIMSKAVAPHTSPVAHWSTYAQLKESEQRAYAAACRELTNAIYEGLDVEREIQAVQEQQLGDTVLLLNDTQLVGFAVCHCGAGTEAGGGACYVKFGAARPGLAARQHFTQLLSACEAFAQASSMSRVVAGVNMGCDEAYRHLLKSGFRTDMFGIAMQRPNEAGYNRPDVYLISDWR